MKKTIQHISLLLAVLLTAGLSSCIKDDYADTSKDTATVNLVFDTRQAGQDGTAQGEENENIKTLRVFITDAEGNVEIQAFKEYTENETSVTLTFMGVSVGTKNFYVIANEASVGLGEEQLGENVVTKIDDAFLNRVITNPAGNAYFPKMRNQINDLGLPITGMLENVAISKDSNNEIEIPITRAVAKVELTLTNATGKEFALNQISFGKFFADQTCLFPDQATLTPGYEAKSFNPSATLTASGDGQTQTFTYYFYESSAGEGAYTIALNGGSDYAAAPIMVDGTPLASIARNTQLKVTGTIESLETEVSLSLKVVVMPWDEVTNPDITFD